MIARPDAAERDAMTKPPGYSKVDHEFPSDITPQDTLRLVRAFSRLEDPKLREMFLEFMEYVSPPK